MDEFVYVLSDFQPKVIIEAFSKGYQFKHKGNGVFNSFKFNGDAQKIEIIGVGFGGLQKKIEDFLIELPQIPQSAIKIYKPYFMDLIEPGIPYVLTDALQRTRPTGVYNPQKERLDLQLHQNLLEQDF